MQRWKRLKRRANKQLDFDSDSENEFNWVVQPDIKHEIRMKHKERLWARQDYPKYDNKNTRKAPYARLYEHAALKQKNTEKAIQKRDEVSSI